MLHNF
jgi:thiol-disulfide isomerase/thioredoxin